MRVQHNMQAINSNRILGVNTTAQAKSTEKLSSGYRINRAADDASGLAISEKMRGQIRGLTRASSNAQDGISLIQVAEGALTETESILQRMRELSVQAANDTQTDDDRTQIQDEINQLTQEIDRIATTTEFNTKKLLDGSRTGAVNEREGSVKVEGSFGNSMVTASVTTDASDKATFTDVIRLEVAADFTEGQSTASTSKLEEKEIKQLYAILKGTDGTAGTDPFGNAKGATKAANDAKYSFEEALASAVTANKAQLLTLKDTASKSSAAVEANEEVLNKLVDDIYAQNEAIVKAKDEGFLKEGTTKEDLKTAVTNLINAQVTDGQTSPASTAITEATNALTELFSTSATVYGTAIAEGAVTATTQKADNTANTALKSAALDNAQTMSAIGTALKTVLTNAAGEISATQITDNANQEKVAKQEKLLEVLDNEELVKAAYDYNKALADQETVKGTSGVTDAAKEAAQEKVDAAKATLDALNKDKEVLKVTDLFGNSADADRFEIASKVDENNNLTVTLKGKDGYDTVVTIARADKLKAGDTVVLTAKEMVESKEAAVGEEALRLQIGANGGQEMSLGINSMRAEDLNIVQVKDGVEGKALDVTNQASAAMAIEAYDMAIQKVSTERAKMGAVQNRLEHTIANLDTAAENTQNAESRIRDVDMASEMVTFSKTQILQQAAQSMLAQANQSTQGILSLLQ